MTLCLFWEVYRLVRETRYTNHGLVSNRQLQMGVFFNVISTIQIISLPFKDKKIKAYM